MRTLLIDGDLFAFEASASVESGVEWEEGFQTLHADIEPAKAHFDSRVNKLQEDLKADEIVVALSEYTDPWRKIVMPSYKASRAGQRKPLCYMKLREWIATKRRSFMKPGLEGDDILGILATSRKILKGEKIVVSVDKDMLQIPGRHLKLNRMKPGPVEDSLFDVTEAQGDYYHMLQTLTGDPTDGYPGVPGVGPKKAAKILDPFWSYGGDPNFPGAWTLVVKAYLKAGLTEEDALVNARVARIARYTDFDFKTQTIKLWTPPA